MNWLQREKGLMGYEFVHMFPMPGIRESYRLRGRYVLTEQDVRSGIEKQNLRNEIIAIADHAMDSHGSGDGCKELEVPYGIPFSCTRPKEYDNMFVACRGASFSHIAASSARLSRTMLSMGEALGEKISEMIKSVIS